MDGFFVPPIHIGDYACFVYQSLLVMVIAFSMLFQYVCDDTYGRKRMYQALLLKQPGASPSPVSGRSTG